MSDTLSKIIPNFLFVLCSFIFPALSFAQSTAFETTDTGWVGCNGPNCDWNTFIALIVRIMRNGYIFAFFVLVVMIAYAGYLILTSGADAGRRKTARSVVSGVVIGMIVMFFSYAIVVYILNTLGVDTGFFQLLQF